MNIRLEKISILMKELDLLDRLTESVNYCDYAEQGCRLFSEAYEDFTLDEDKFFNFIELQKDIRHRAIAQTLEDMAGYKLFVNNISDLKPLEME